MSKWYEVEKDNISFSDSGKEILLLFGQDKDGSLYAFVKTEDMVDALREVTAQSDFSPSLDNLNEV
jgi:hypothetical protein